MTNDGFLDSGDVFESFIVHADDTYRIRHCPTGVTVAIPRAAFVWDKHRLPLRFGQRIRQPDKVRVLLLVRDTLDRYARGELPRIRP